MPLDCGCFLYIGSVVHHGETIYCKTHEKLKDLPIGIAETCPTVSPDDVVTRLRGRYCSHGNNYDGAWQPLEWPSSCERCELDNQAADEIERLRKALALAVGEVSIYGPYGNRSPEQLYEFFLWTVTDE